MTNLWKTDRFSVDAQNQKNVWFVTIPIIGIAVLVGMVTSAFGDFGRYAAIGAVLSLAALFVAFRAPFHFFFLFLVFIPINVYLLRFSDVTLGPYNIAGGLKDVLLFLSVVAALFTAHLRDQKLILKDIVSLLIVTYAAWATFQSLRDNILFGLVGLRVVVEFTLAYVTVKITVKHADQNKRLLLALICGGIISILLGLPQVANLAWSQLGVNPVLGRLTGVFTQVNMYGVYLGLIFTVGLLLIFENLVSKKWRPLLIVFEITTAFLLLLTFSRRAWVAVFLAVTLWTMIRFRVRKLGELVLLLILFSGVLLFIDWQLLTEVSVTDSISHRLATMSSTEWQEDESVTYRIDETRFLWNKITEDPVTLFVGEGLGTFGAGLRTIVGEGSLHNSYLAIWVEMGIVGLGIFLSILVITLYRAMSIIHTNSDWGKIAGISMAGLLVILISALFGDMIGNFPFNLFLWLFVGSINVSYSRLTQSIAA